eukprot:m.85084 g.85084  ORF g.85084 m.85084 type:complete len:69 (+) comp36426_c0_seq1:1379-1585(+)
MADSGLPKAFPPAPLQQPFLGPAKRRRKETESAGLHNNSIRSKTMPHGTCSFPPRPLYKGHGALKGQA